MPSSRRYKHEYEQALVESYVAWDITWTRMKRVESVPRSVSSSVMNSSFMYLFARRATVGRRVVCSYGSPFYPWAGKASGLPVLAREP